MFAQFLRNADGKRCGPSTVYSVWLGWFLKVEHYVASDKRGCIFKEFFEETAFSGHPVVNGFSLHEKKTKIHNNHKMKVL